MEELNDIVGSRLKIFQNPDFFKFSLDSVLLSNFVEIHLNDKKIIDLCTGNAPIPLLLSLKTKHNIYGVEIQKDIYNLARKSVEINKKNDQIFLLNCNVKELNNTFSADTFDIVTVNPPYFPIEKTSFLNTNLKKTIARHEIELNLEDLFKISFYLLKTNGAFYMVHRTSRFFEIVDLLKQYRLTPKTIQFVYASPKKESKIFLVKAVKNGKMATKLLPPLFIDSY